MSKNGFVILSGFNFRAVVTLCRRFSNKNIPYFIIALNEEDPIFSTAFKNKVVVVRKTKKLEVDTINSWLTLILKNKDLEQLTICPTSEFLNEFLLSNRKNIETPNIKIPLVEKPTYDLVSNKQSFVEFCERFEIQSPPEFPTIENIEIPFVAKPIINIQHGRTMYPYLIFNENDLKEFHQKENSNDFFFQEYIEGQSLYLFYYIDKKNKIYKFSQTNLAQQPDGKSIIFAASGDWHEKPISDKFEKALLEINYKGYIMIEMILRNNVFYLIEANPRFWGPFKMVTDAYPDFTNAFISDWAKSQKITNYKKKYKYLWLGGFFSKKGNNKTIKWYQSKPKSLNIFLLKNLKYDVYFKFNSIKYFFKELFIK